MTTGNRNDADAGRRRRPSSLGSPSRVMPYAECDRPARLPSIARRCIDRGMGMLAWGESYLDSQSTHRNIGRGGGAKNSLCVWA